MLPSCVPSTSFETAGHTIIADHIEQSINDVINPLAGLSDGLVKDFARLDGSRRKVAFPVDRCTFGLPK